MTRVHERLSPAAARWEIDALTRLAAVRTVADAILAGHWITEAGTIDATADLARSAADRLRWRDACRAA